MVNKRSTPSGARKSAKADNFKLIKGIGATVENRLHQAKITTYEQLASLSPAKILDLTDKISGLTIDRIVRQNWIGQARALSLRGDEPETSPKEEAESDQHYSSFATELLLDAGNNVIHTRVMHVQTGDEEIWGGWDEPRFVNFFVQRAEIGSTASAHEIDSKFAERPGDSATTPDALAANVRIEPDSIEQPIVISEPVADTSKPSIPGENIIEAEATLDQEPSGVSEASGKETISVVKGSDIIAGTWTGDRIQATRQPSRMEILTGDSNLPSKLLPHDQPFGVRIELDMADFTLTREERVPYIAHIKAQSLSNRQLQSVIHHVQGKVEPKGITVLDLKGLFLEPGSYRLGANVTVKPKAINAAATSKVNFQIEGGVLQVY
jgi:hypothetical protein